MAPHSFPPPESRRPASAWRWLHVALLAACTTGCAAWFGDDKTEEQRAEDLYFRANSALQQNNFTDALEKYKKLETAFPFSRYAQKAAIESAYAHYKNYQFEEAVVILDQFIKLNPSHPNLDYVYYLKGLAYYNYGQNPINRILRRDPTSKDPKPLREAFDTFKRLRQNYPDSIYGEDTWLRIVALRNILAVHEIRIADYYMRRQAYLAVINRCKYLLEHYPNAQHTPEALVLLAEAYRRVGSTDLARDTLEVLALNYPDFARVTGNFAQVSERDRKTWFSRMKDMTGTLLDRLRAEP